MRFKRTIRAFAIVAASAVHALSIAAQCAKDSPPRTAALVELYTSEGCDSCPPADQWFSRLGREVAATGDAVLLALHVDYWDRLGWPDRFASPDYGERQRSLVRHGGSGVVYTPGVFLNQSEFRGWNSPASLRRSLGEVNAKPARAGIRLEIDPVLQSRIAVRARFTLTPGVRNPQAFVALYENGLSTEVKAGENRGVLLKHDHVVRELAGPVNPSTEFVRAFELGNGWKPGNLGVAAFVQDSFTGEILQAISLGNCTKG